MAKQSQYFKSITGKFKPGKKTSKRKKFGKKSGGGLMKSFGHFGSFR